MADETNSKVFIGYKQKTGTGLGNKIPLGFTYQNNNISLEDFYGNYRQFIDDGNFIYINKNEPEGDIKPRIFLEKIE